MNKRVIIPVMAREPVTWYKNHLAGEQTMHWKLKDVRFLNDVISLFFLPHCGVCHPAKCFCNVTISLKRAHYVNYDSLTTVLQVTWERGISFVIVCVFYFQIWLLRADYELARKSISAVQQTRNKTVQGSEGLSSGTATAASHGKKHERITPETDRTTNEQ